MACSDCRNKVARRVAALIFEGESGSIFRPKMLGVEQIRMPNMHANLTWRIGEERVLSTLGEKSALSESEIRAAR